MRVRVREYEEDNLHTQGARRKDNNIKSPKRTNGKSKTTQKKNEVTKKTPAVAVRKHLMGASKSNIIGRSDPSVL